MIFNSFDFIFIFLPIVLLLSFCIRRQSLIAWLGFTSYVFYGLTGNWWFIVPLFLSTISDFYIAKRIHDSHSRWYRNFYLLISMSVNLGMLALFKYGYFLTDNFVSLRSIFGVSSEMPFWSKYFQFILPAGISFYTFQTMSYVIDVWRGNSKPEVKFSHFLAFVSFFPQLVAGPIARDNELIPQLKKLELEGIRPQWRAGALLFAMGLVKKVMLADQIANLIDPRIVAIGDQGFYGAWIALFGYSAQIYFDFSGYTDMALGLACFWGVRLPINFDSPYKSLDPSDFWQRWHMTLSRWLRDYLYISLGGNRGRTKLFTLRNLMITMFLGGLWHGSKWTFVCWGIFHGLLLVFYHTYQTQWDRLSIPVRRTAMFLLITLSWSFFRAESFPHLLRWMYGLIDISSIPNFSILDSSGFLLTTALVCVALGIALFAPNSNKLVEQDSLSPIFLLVLGILTGFALVFMSESSYFIYFKF